MMGQPVEPAQRRLLDLREVAQYLGCSKRHVERLLASHELRAVHLSRLVRVDLHDLMTFVDDLKTDEAFRPPMRMAR
jgi:excisionase family DNA binding protein